MLSQCQKKIINHGVSEQALRNDSILLPQLFQLQVQPKQQLLGRRSIDGLDHGMYFALEGLVRRPDKNVTQSFLCHLFLMHPYA